MGQEMWFRRLKSMLAGLGVTDDDIKKAISTSNDAADSNRGSSVGYILELEGKLTSKLWLERVQASESGNLAIIDPKILLNPQVLLYTDDKALSGAMRKHKILVFNSAVEGNLVQPTIATDDPTFHSDGIEELKKLIWGKTGANPKIEIVLASEKSIREVLQKYYQPGGMAIWEGNDSSENCGIELKSEHDRYALETEAQAEPVVRYVSSLILQAVISRASDIHVESIPAGIRVRFRIDGKMQEIPQFVLTGEKKRYALAVISRIKIMAKLDIAERRKPQDGRIRVTIENHKNIDCRVSVVPQEHGETCVLRILDKSALTLDLDNLGFRADQMTTVKQVLQRRNGLIVVTGPTGSGKTTTLYSALEFLNQPDVNICTIEDPVEYELSGITQMPVNERIGLDFSDGLRALLRQDPDIIMVGEIRDAKTADIAVKASLTGHLVFSTLHANDAASTVARLSGAGIEPQALIQTLRLVTAQSLVRKVCTHCRVKENVPVKDLVALGITPEQAIGITCVRGKGCGQCHGGYKGRVAVHEVMPITPALQECIARGGANVLEIKAIAAKEGVESLSFAVIDLLKRRVISFSEAQAFIMGVGL